MINSKKQESLPRGSVSFPIEYYKIDTSEPSYDLPVHWHVDFEFIHILRGGYTLVSAAQEYELKPGDYFLMSSGILHGDSPNFRGKCIYESVVFEPSMLKIQNYVTEQFLDKLTEGELFFSLFFNQETDKELSKLLAELFKIMKSPFDGFEYDVISRLFLILGYIYKNKLYSTNTHYVDGGGKLIWLKCVLNLIKQEYGTQLTLATMAESAGFSPKYFCRVFHETTHFTPMEYLNQYRINRAAEMLLNTNESIEEISYLCGFNDISYFIKLFKRYKNNTPLQYRKQKVV